MSKKLNKKQLKKTQGGSFKKEWEVIKKSGKGIKTVTAPVHK